MAYNEKLAQRISGLLKSKKGIVEKKMFGGICFMYKDKMITGIVENKLMVRCLPDDYNTLLKKPHAGEMTFTGKPLKGFLYIAGEGVKTDRQLQKWLDIGIEFANKTPQKKKNKK